MPAYLTPEWLDALDEALRSATVSVPAPVLLEQVVTGVPGRGEVAYRVRLSESGARVDHDHTAAADVRLTTDYGTAVAIARGEQNAQIALARGRLRLGGQVDALSRVTDALVGFAAALASLRAVTTYPLPDPEVPPTAGR